MKKQVEPVVEVERLVREIRDAWAEMLSRRDATMDRGSRVA
jgi:flagellar protein FliS